MKRVFFLVCAMAVASCSGGSSRGSTAEPTPESMANTYPQPATTDEPSPEGSPSPNLTLNVGREVSLAADDGYPQWGFKEKLNLDEYLTTRNLQGDDKADSLARDGVNAGAAIDISGKGKLRIVSRDQIQEPQLNSNGEESNIAADECEVLVEGLGERYWANCGALDEAMP